MKGLALGVVIGATVSGGFHRAIGSASKKFNTLGLEIEGLSNQRGLVSRFEKDQAALEQARLQLGKTQKQVMALKLALRKDPADEGTAKALAQTQTRAEKLSAAVEKQRQTLDKSRQAMSKAGFEVGDLSREYTRLGKSLDATRAKYDRMQQRMAKKSAAGARLGELKGQLMGVAGAVYAGARMMNQAAAFESSEVRLSTVLNTKDLPGDLAKAKKHALDFARSGLTSETEMLNIQYALNSAGLDASAARAGSDVVAKVAKITDGSAEGVGEVIATVFNNLGTSLEGTTQERLTRIGELLTKTQFKFQIRDFDQLGESLKYATPALSQFGVPLEQGVTLLGALNSAGMQGSMAGTSLAATFRNLGKASEEFGFDIARSADGNLDFVQTMENIEASVGGFEGMDQATIDRMQKAFGEEGQRGVVLLGKNLKGLRAAQDDVSRGSKGLIDQSYQRFLGSTSGQMTVLSNNIRIVGTTLAGTLLPALNAIITPLTAVAKWVGALIERFPFIGRLIGGVVAGLGTFVVGLTAITGATWLWNAALLANPIGLVVAGVAAAAVAIITFWEPIKGFFSGLWDGIKAIFKDGVGFLTKVWEMSPLGLLFKAGQKLTGFVGGLFGGSDSEATPGIEKKQKTGGLGRAASAVALGTVLAVTPVAAQTPGGQPPKAPTVAGQVQAPKAPPVAGQDARVNLPPVQQSQRQPDQTTINAPITIHAAPGMDERAVATEVSRALDERERQAQVRRRGALYD